MEKTATSEHRDSGDERKKSAGSLKETTGDKNGNENIEAEKAKG